MSDVAPMADENAALRQQLTYWQSRRDALGVQLHAFLQELLERRNDKTGSDLRRDMSCVVGSADLGMVFGQSAYTMSEPHLSGYRLVIGFKTLSDVQAAHEAIASLSKRPTHVEVWKS